VHVVAHIPWLQVFPPVQLPQSLSTPHILCIPHCFDNVAQVSVQLGFETHVPAPLQTHEPPEQPELPLQKVSP
jgi:hypothetical protein